MEKPNEAKTTMIANQENKTKMVASMVKIKALRPISLNDGRSLRPGQEAEVDESEAKEFCDKKFRGQFAFSGERIGQVERHNLVRAVRI